MQHLRHGRKFRLGKRLFSRRKSARIKVLVPLVPLFSLGCRNLERRNGGLQAGLERSKNAIFYLGDGFPTITGKAAAMSDRPPMRCQPAHAARYSFRLLRMATPLITPSHDRSSTPHHPLPSQTKLGLDLTGVPKLVVFKENIYCIPFPVQIRPCL